jgi:DNA repair protein RadC
MVPVLERAGKLTESLRHLWRVFYFGRLIMNKTGGKRKESVKKALINGKVKPQTRKTLKKVVYYSADDFWKDLQDGHFASMVKESTKGRQVLNSRTVFNILKPFFADCDDVESIYCMFLNSNKRIRSIDKMCTGTIDSATIHPREIVKRLIKTKSSGVIMAHNHPSGNTVPSDGDKAITVQVALALRAVDARLYDHLIIGDGYVSLADEGVIDRLLADFDIWFAQIGRD